MKTATILKTLALSLVISLTSCSKSDDGGTPAPAAQHLYTTATVAGNDTNHATLNTDVTLTTEDTNGNDISANTTYTLNGTVITMPYQFTTPGMYTITATYQGSLTTITLLITDADVHKPMVTVEDYTGTWCGYCPRLAYKIDHLDDTNTSVIPIAVHNGDSMTYSGGSTLENAAGITGFPTGKINRTLTWDETDNQVLAQLTAPTTVGLSINTTLSGNSLTVNVGAKFALDVPNSKLVVVVLEDGLHANQVNYMNNDTSSPWYGAGNPIVNFEHNNVLRTSLTNVLGDAIPNTDTEMGDEFTRTLNFTIPGSYDSTKLEVVAMIVNQAGGVINSQMVQAGSNKAYELAQ